MIPCLSLYFAPKITILNKIKKSQTAIKIRASNHKIKKTHTKTNKQTNKIKKTQTKEYNYKKNTHTHNYKCDEERTNKVKKIIIIIINKGGKRDVRGVEA